ncbi:hypothetical protein VHEMI07044 [[Torrubiella] hemipterigena]|uniref:Uncharacterized protein n=1 Tax=[Torrubiella] hemipterigena TaxID=1531966 RepID=A0A0A1TKY3_9HYPO|nr:hypothetical protein VHEMI07044 [[Torrubiella] hemipterigena]
MRLTSKQSSLVLLLLPALVAGLSTPASADQAAGLPRGDKADKDAAIAIPGRPVTGTKDAPVDGKDGKPHLGPFVDTDRPASIDTKPSKDTAPLKGKPKDPTIVDGKKIPETNDNIMADKGRQKPEEGKTGTEGGVTEKDKVRKEQEDKTGEKSITKVEAPKEQPPLPHSAEEKLNKGKPKPVDKTQDKEKDVSKSKTEKEDISYTGLDKPDDLPEMNRDKQPVPHSADKEHLNVNKPSSSKTKPTTITQTGTDDEGIIQPFHSFILSLTMILVSEVGDKTFLVAALMAMKHDRMVVFSAAFGALLVMTVLSAVLGHAVPVLIPKRLTSFLAAGLFFVFGAKLLLEGMKMDPNEGVAAEMHEVEQELAEKEKEMGRGRHTQLSGEALEMGLGRSPRSKGGMLSSPPRSPSQSPVRASRRSGGLSDTLHGVGNLFGLLISPVWVQTFAMTFLGEWGDRSQIATIAMAAGQDYWWVTLGAVCGHAVCTGVAVIGGRAIAGRVSMKVVTIGGAVAFLLFGLIYFIESFYA